MPDIFDKVSEGDIFDRVATAAEQKPPVVRQTAPGAVAPTNLVPAIRLMGGELALGQEGDTHNDIIQREDLRPEQIDQRGFSVDGKQFLDRESAATGTQLPTEFEPGRLHSTDLPQQRSVMGGPSLEELRGAYGGPFWQTFTRPRLEIPGPQIDPKEDWKSAAVKEVFNAAKSVPEFFTSDLGALSVVSAKVMPRLTSAGFAVDLGRSAIQQGYDFVKNRKDMTPAQKAVAVVDFLATSLFGVGAGAHAAGAFRIPGLQEAKPAPDVVAATAQAKATPITAPAGQVDLTSVVAQEPAIPIQRPAAPAIPRPEAPVIPRPAAPTVERPAGAVTPERPTLTEPERPTPPTREPEVPTPKKGRGPYRKVGDKLIDADGNTVDAQGNIIEERTAPTAEQPAQTPGLPLAPTKEEPKPLPSEPGEAQPSAVAPAAPAVVSAEKAPAVTGVEPAIRQPITDAQKTQLKQLGLTDKDIADLQSGNATVSEVVARKLPGQPERGPDHAKALDEARIQAQADIEQVFKPAISKPTTETAEGQVKSPEEWEKQGVKYARRPDGTLKTKEEYTPEEWKAYTDSVIDAKLKTPKPTPPPAKPQEGAGEGLKPGEGAGPGAAPVGDVPQDPQIVQLTKALQKVDSQPIPFRERMREMLNLSEHQSLAKTAIGKSLDGLKTARDFLIRKWDGVKDWDDVKRVKGELSAEINERGWSLRQFENKAKRDVPRKRDQEAISSWLDTGGNPELLKKAEAETAPRYKQSYRDAQNLSPEMRANAENIRSYFEARLQEAIDAGVLKDGIEDYIHRIYKRDTPEKQRILNQVQSGVLNTRNPGLAMQRVFGFDYEAEKAGLPIVKSFIPRIVDYEYSLARVIADRKAVKQFMGIKMPDGRPMIDVAGIGSPVENAEGITEAMLIKPSFKRGDSNETGSKNYRRDYLQRNDYPAFRKWKWIERDPATGRDTFVEGDVLVHPKAVDRIDALMAKSAIRRSKLGSAALGASSIFKQTMLDFSGFHQVQIAVHGMEHRVMPWGAVKDIDLADPKVQGLLKGGLNIGGDFHAFDYREGLVGHSLSRLIPGIGEVMQAYHEYLFRDYIPRVKTTMALHALERNRARMPNLSQEQLNYLTAKQANAAFGGLNYIVMERSKTAQDLARLIFLAPDFLEARGSFAAQSLQRAGKKGEWSNEQRTALFLGAATMWITARIANKLNDDQWHFEPENAFSLVHNGRAYSLRTVQGDLLHLWDNTFQFFLNRLNPVFGRTALEMASGRDYFGRKRSRMELAWDLFANIRPIAFRSNQERRLLESIANSFGLQVKRWNDTDKAFDLAKKWKDEHGVGERGEFIYDAEKDPLRPLKLALTSNDDGLATKEIRKLFQSGYDRGRLVNYFRRYFNMPFTGSFANDAKWKKTLTDDQLKTVETAAEHKKSVARLFVKALGNYDAALKGQ